MHDVLVDRSLHVSPALSVTGATFLSIAAHVSCGHSIAAAHLSMYQFCIVAGPPRNESAHDSPLLSPSMHHMGKFAPHVNLAE